jgi:hypothetical protein
MHEVAGFCECVKRTSARTPADWSTQMMAWCTIAPAGDQLDARPIRVGSQHENLDAVPQTVRLGILAECDQFILQERIEEFACGLEFDFVAPQLIRRPP